MLIQKILNVFAALKNPLPRIQEVTPPPPPGPVVPGTPVNESVIILIVFAIGLGFYISNKYSYNKKRA